MTSTNEQEKIAQLEQKIEKLTKENEGLKEQDKKSGLYAKYLDSIPSPVLAVDECFTVTFMNKFGAKLVGETVLTAVGKKCYDLFRTGDCHTDKCACAQAMKNRGVSTSQTVAHLGNLEIPIQYVGRPLYDANKKVIGAVEIVTDVTQMNNIISKAITSSKNVAAISDNVNAQCLRMAEMGKKTAEVAAQMSIGMQQVITAAQQV